MGKAVITFEDDENGKVSIGCVMSPDINPEDPDMTPAQDMGMSVMAFLNGYQQGKVELVGREA